MLIARTTPFNLADIGRTNLKLFRRNANDDNKAYLMRVEAHIQGSSIWTYISRETEPYPLKLRNDTHLAFEFQQVVSVSRPIMNAVSDQVGR
jgi:vacuolar protein sorting-associated protein 13A/C